MNRNPDSAVARKHMPPDEGWAWMVFLAFALNNLLVFPLVSGFGLIFQETFPKYGISGVGTSVIITAHQAFGMAFSIFNRRLVTKYGSRKMANTGGILIFIGIILTSQTESVITFVIAHSLMTSIGLSLVMSSFYFGMRAYCDLKRKNAMRTAMLLIGIGSIIMPQLINYMMFMYTTEWAIAMLGAISLHAFVAAMILRPIKWYRMPISAAVPLMNQSHTELYYDFGASQSGEQSSPNKSNEPKRKPSGTDRTRSQIEEAEEETLRMTWFKWWKSDTIEVNLSSSLNIFNETTEPNPAGEDTINTSNIEMDDVMSDDIVPDESASNDPDEEDQIDKMTLKYQLNKIFHEGYFKDSVFTNLIVGMTIEEVSEVNFVLLTPFILRDLSMEMWQIANVLSVIAAADLVYRFASGYIGEWCHKSARVMYMMSLCMLIFTRTIFYFASSYESLLIVAAGLGIGKGVRTIYKNQIIPKFVETEKNVFIATNITMITYSLALLLSGPMFGTLRDVYSNYHIPIIVINVLTFITIILWVVEYIVLAFKPKEINPTTTS